jgi:hypothetical protein
MQRRIRTSVAAAAILIAASITGTSVNASVIAVTSGFFSGDPVTTFTGVADGTEVNGLTVNGIHFNYLIGGTPTNGQVVIDGGPGTTNTISPPNIVSVGNNTGTLMLTLPTSASALGYGFAVLSTGSLPAATTITLFSGTTNVGSLSYPGASDPNFTGGFAGIESTLPFNIVDVTFDSVNAPAFAADNFVFTSGTPVPEPGTFALVASALAGLIAIRRRLVTV